MAAKKLNKVYYKIKIIIVYVCTNTIGFLFEKSLTFSTKVSLYPWFSANGRNFDGFTTRTH